MDLSKVDGLKFVVQLNSTRNLAHLEKPTSVCGLVNDDSLPVDDSHDTYCWRCKDAVSESDGTIKMEFDRFSQPKTQGPNIKNIYSAFDFADFELSENALVAVRLTSTQNWISTEKYLEMLKSERGTG